MENLIPVNYETEQPTISARDLHKALDISKRFSAWFEANSHGFVENEDFIGGVPKGTGQSVWRRTVFTGL